MSRWSYKTVHFSLKKDGLLGGAFLDDVEMEEVLNQYGQAGWELVSVFETADGVMAVLKQPIRLPSNDDSFRSERWSRGDMEPVNKLVTAISQDPIKASLEPDEEGPEEDEDEKAPELEEYRPEMTATSGDEEDSFDDEPEQVEDDREDDEDEGDSAVGAIRIE